MNRKSKFDRALTMHLSDGGANVVVLMARYGIMMLEDVLVRVQHSNPSPQLHGAVIAALLVIHDIKPALGAWFRDEPSTLQVVFDDLFKAVRTLEKAGLSVTQIAREAQRFNPQLKLKSDGALIWLFYNPSTEKRDIERDGWRGMNALPRRSKPKGK